MKTQRIVTTVIALGTLGLLPLCARPLLAQDTAEELYQAALYQEEVQGNLERAIEIYERVLAEHPQQRPVAAQALMHLGLCHEKLGRTGAESAYRRLIRDYADQGAVVVRARARLAAIRQEAREASGEATAISTRRIQKWIHGEASPMAVTPDGRELVYRDEWFGNLAVRELANGRSRDLTHDSSWTVWGAAVSPDGGTVSYKVVEPSSGSLHLVGMDGGSSRLLYREVGRDVAQQEWSSDGKGIFALVNGPTGVEAMRIPVGDGRATVIRTLGPAIPDALSASPDDAYLVYGLPVPGDGGNHDLRILSTDGGSDVPLITHPSDDRLLGWLPGTESVLFLSDRSGTVDLWAVDVRDGAPAGQPRLVRRRMGEVSPVGLTDDGVFVYSSYTRWFSTGVAPFDPATDAVRMEASQEIMGSVMPATWSPDGRALAFVVEEEAPAGSGYPFVRSLHVRDLATGVERELAGDVDARNQRWSPDGERILMSGFDRTEEREGYRGGLYVVDVESGAATPVLELRPESETVFWSDLGAEWSRDGSAIIYSLYDHARKEGRLVWRSLASAEERELFRSPTLTSRMLALSPDGSRLAFGLRSDPHGYSTSIHSGGRLMVVGLDGDEAREFHRIREQGRVWSLQWAPDGEHVLYTKRSQDGSGASIWRVSVADGSAEELWSFGPDNYDAFFRVSPDGRRAAYTTYHQEFEVWMMENLVAALQEEEMAPSGGDQTIAAGDWEGDGDLIWRF